jgi:hypothetical protein
VRAGREHNTAAVRTHAAILPALREAADELRTLGDPGYQGASDTITVAFTKPRNARPTTPRQQLNKAHNSLPAIGERGNSRRYSHEDGWRSRPARTLDFSWRRLSSATAPSSTNRAFSIASIRTSSPDKRHTRNPQSGHRACV